jgi:hypothetical protein
VSDLNDLEVLARAAIDVPDLARGVEGEVEMEMEGMFGQEDFRRVLNEIRDGQRTLVAAGWRRDAEKEELAPYSHNIEVACYRKQFTPGRRSRWVYVTVATRFGLVAKFHGVKELPW